MYSTSTYNIHMNSAHKLPTPTPCPHPTVILNTADRSSGVVFIMASRAKIGAINDDRGDTVHSIRVHILCIQTNVQQGKRFIYNKYDLLVLRWSPIIGLGPNQTSSFHLYYLLVWSHSCTNVSKLQKTQKNSLIYSK